MGQFGLCQNLFGSEKTIYMLGNMNGKVVSLVRRWGVEGVNGNGQCHMEKNKKFNNAYYISITLVFWKLD